MIKRITITNDLGDSMEYRIEGYTESDEPGLLITNIDGLGPVKANVNMTDYSTIPGQVFNSIHLSGRNIVVSALYSGASIEESRQLSYLYFPVGEKVKVEVETDNRTAYTYGYVESNEPNIFDEKSGCQISIMCESPYFESLGSDVRLAHENTNQIIDYTGDVNAGMEITLELVNNYNSDDFPTLDYATITKDGETTVLDFTKMAELFDNSTPETVVPSAHLFAYRKNSGVACLGEYPTPDRNEIIPIAVGNDLYLIFDGVYDDNAKCYKFSDNKWSRIADLPHSGTGSSAVYFDGHIHVLGGGARLGSTDHYYYDQTTNRWFSSTPLPYPFKEGCAVVFENAIHILGSNDGIDGFQVDEDGDNDSPAEQIETRGHYKWNGGTSWERVSTLPKAFETGSAVVFNDGIHLFGGNDNDVEVTYTENYSHYRYNNGAWTALPDIPGRLKQSPEGNNGGGQPHPSAFVLDDAIYVFSIPAPWDGSLAAWYYVWKNGTWTEIKDESPINRWINPRFCVIGKTVFILDTPYTNSGDFGVPRSQEPANNVRLICGDKIVVSSVDGDKSVYLYRRGSKINIINILDKNPSWLRLHKGLNVMSYSTNSASADVHLSVRVKPIYMGV